VKDRQEDARALRASLAALNRPALKEFLEQPTSWAYHRPEARPCVRCGRMASMLFAPLDDPARALCGECEAKMHRDVLDRLRDAVIAYRSSEDRGERERARETILRLDNFGRETIASIDASRNTTTTPTKARKGFL
jgi:hypothetical protein